MQKYSKFIKLAIFLVLASLMLTGCNPFQLGDDATTAHTSRTFAITDVNPYPGKDYQIPDKLAGSTYNIYLYIINNGGNDKKNTAARNVKVTLIDETRSLTVVVATTSIPADLGYTVLEGLSYPFDARVHFHVEEDIYKNGKHEIFSKENSNSFNINYPVLQTITVTPANASLPAGLTQTYTATANYSNGLTKDVSNSVIWSSSDLSKATMSDRDATGIAVGPCLITATLEGIAGTTNLTVAPPLLQSIIITPVNASVPAGLTQIYTATAHYSNGSTQNVSNSAIWSSSDVVKATMLANVATGIDAGTCLITATIGGISGTTNLIVDPPVLQSVVVTPTNVSIQVGETQRFKALANYSNGSTTDVSQIATWTSFKPSVATMTGEVATGVNAGSSTITATFLGKSGSTSLTVTAPILQSILVTPPNASIQVGQTQTFTALALFSNGSSTNISNTATWSSSNESIATLAGAVATGVQAGSSTITATFQNKSGTAVLTVNAVPPPPEPSNRLIWEKEIVEE